MASRLGSMANDIKANGGIIDIMEWELVPGQMEVSTMEVGKMVLSMGTGHSLGLMVRYMLVNGRMASNMVKVFIPGQMVKFSRVCTLRARRMGTAFASGQNHLRRSTADNGKIMNVLVWAYKLIMMDQFTIAVHGAKINQNVEKEKVSCLCHVMSCHVVSDNASHFINATCVQIEG